MAAYQWTQEDHTPAIDNLCTDYYELIDLESKMKERLKTFLADGGSKTDSRYVDMINALRDLGNGIVQVKAEIEAAKRDFIRMKEGYHGH